MKNKIVCLLLVLVMVVAMLASCGGGKKCKKHVDEDPLDAKCDVCGEAMTCPNKHNVASSDKDGDKKCDICGKKVTVSAETDDEWPFTVAWEAPTATVTASTTANTTGDSVSGSVEEKAEVIYFQMTHNSNLQQLSSGCQRYLAGRDSNANEAIDDDIIARNAAALSKTNTLVAYNYYADNNEAYMWGANINTMVTGTKNQTATSPDIYCNFVYDMVAASLKGAFANLKATSTDDINMTTLPKYTTEYKNYFQFNEDEYQEAYLEAITAKENFIEDRGYMYEYMESLTLSPNKLYCLASDYFTDLVRAFLVVPVNVELLEGLKNADSSKTEGILTDYDGNGFDISDFYTMVNNKEWTYDVMIKYANAVYTKVSSGDGYNLNEDILGFVVSADGLPASGLLYTSNVTVINRELQNDGSYVYSYPNYDDTDDAPLFSIANAIAKLFGEASVATFDEANLGNYGTDSQTVAIRQRFAKNNILFGNIITVGALEYGDYQGMMENEGKGFGILPVPLYEQNAEKSERYLTLIHNIGRIGGISCNSIKFTQASAFLDYQSTNSTDILDTYYDINLTFATIGASGGAGNKDMLQYIRQNVRSAFDKTFEDALGEYFKDQSADASFKWHTIIGSAGGEGDGAYGRYLIGDGMRGEYDKWNDQKSQYLAQLEGVYDLAP